MAPEFYMKCPNCKHVYNVHRMIHEMGEDFLMKCPLCLHRYPRKQGKVVSASFPL